MCRSKPVGIIRAKGSIFFAIDYVYLSKQELRSIKRHLKDQMSSMMNLYMHDVQCFSMTCKKRHHKYRVSRAKLFTSSDIESNPGPVVTQGNNPNNLIDTITILISTTWLEDIRCWWCR